MAPMASPLVLRSALLDRAGFVHGFSVRTGGVSEGLFASLNLARRTEDRPDAVAENHRRFAEAVGFSPDALLGLSQVHGPKVHRVGAADVSSARTPEGDGLVTTAVGVAVGVRVADCLPLLLGDPRTGAAAAVHCGWRGVAAGVVRAAFDRLREEGVSAPDLRAAIGPHIRVERFEVGREVVEALTPVAEGCAFVRRDLGPRPHVDLAAIVRAQLTRIGIREIDDVGGCTRAEDARFFSYRRDGQRSGRHLAAIVAGGPGST